MIQDYFLLGIGFLAVLFGTFSDLKKREVANWLNYSLLGFALIFRFGVALNSGNWEYLFYGLMGFGIMFIMGNVFYYTQAFAGGDAKLLMALGAVFPYYSYMEVGVYCGAFIGMLLVLGLFYSLIYSLILALMNFRGFWNSFKIEFGINKWMALIGILFGLVSIFFGGIGIYLGGMLIILPIMFIYLKAVEKSCLVVEMKPSELTDGEWLNEDVKIGGKWIRKSVHGLSLKEIEWIRKHGKGKKIVVKQGIPFVPVFLINIIVMGYVFLVLSPLNLQEIFSLVL